MELDRSYYEETYWSRRRDCIGLETSGRSYMWASQENLEEDSGGGS
jgi:hypothetical protein